MDGTSDSLHTWQGWAERLRLTRRVIRIDLPGFSLTGPHPENNYTMDADVAFVKQVLKILNLPAVVLAGNSLGDSIAWQTAVKHPALVAKLILVDSAGYPFISESVPLGLRMLRIEILQPALRLFFGSQCGEAQCGKCLWRYPSCHAGIGGALLRAGFARRQSHGFVQSHDSIQTWGQCGANPLYPATYFNFMRRKGPTHSRQQCMPFSSRNPDKRTSIAGEPGSCSTRRGS
ncbi:MAG: hypothetical protein CFE38_15760 [Comamonadaceae bacterium PBBC1]|nr:MAG: hypothetical protein CFE38_15760 [Comamonadaceae bacterium PBBC1]